MRRVLVLALLLTLTLAAFVPPSNAEIRVAEAEHPPHAVPGLRTEATRSVSELAPADSVARAVYHLQAALPVLAQQDWTVYVIRRRASLAGVGDVMGLALPHCRAAYVFASGWNAGPVVVGFREVRVPVVVPVPGGDPVWRLEKVEMPVEEPAAPYGAAYAAAHEIGHLVRFLLLGREDLDGYIRLRGIRVGSGWASDPEEVFAEDFRWLFGSEGARVVPYRANAPEPGERERERMCKMLGGLLDVDKNR